MINTSNLVYSRLLQNSSNSSCDDFSIDEGFLGYLLDNKNTYTSFYNKSDNSLKLIDNIMTKNLLTFIKSIELTHRFYIDTVQSYLN